MAKSELERLRDGERPKNPLELLHDHLVRVCEARDTAAFRYMEFKIDPPLKPEGGWWLDVTLGESRSVAQRWVLQWWLGLSGFGISLLTDDDPAYTHQPDEILPDMDSIARKLGLTT